jgi:hypothetical protein
MFDMMLKDNIVINVFYHHVFFNGLTRKSTTTIAVDFAISCSMAFNFAIDCSMAVDCT